MEAMGAMTSLEEDFIGLVEGAPTKGGFHRGAQKMLGDEYKELGLQIVSEIRPDLIGKFLSYFED